jgi:hypothetical protein
VPVEAKAAVAGLLIRRLPSPPMNGGAVSSEKKKKDQPTMADKAISSTWRVKTSATRRKPKPK